tara:strand:- start:16 stop:189 length:174 start_codon:yes stop_codon:yes gene_type:complete
MSKNKQIITVSIDPKVVTEFTNISKELNISRSALSEQVIVQFCKFWKEEKSFGGIGE